MKSSFFSKILSAAVVATAFAVVGSVPASAQAVTRDGSLLPHYYGKDGDLKWDGWGPQADEQKAVRPSRSLYLSAKPHVHHRHPRS